jgi:hypothetical protein
MDTKDVIVVVAAVLSATVTICVPLVNHSLTRRRYASEKLWDVRKDMYSSLLSNISEAKQQASFAVSLNRSPSDEKQQADALECTQKALEAVDRAQEALRANYLLCSPRMRKIWADIHNQTGLIYVVYGPADKEFADAIRALDKGYDDVLEAAEIELKIRGIDFDRLMDFAEPTLRALLREFGRSFRHFLGW